MKIDASFLGFIMRAMNDFLNKISPTFGGKQYLIPPPQLTPKQREQRRLAYRNERNLYKRTSSLSGESIVSFFHQDSPYRVYSHDEWWSDDWDAIEYSRDFDFGRPFFDQFAELQLEVPRAPLINNKPHNSPYCNFADGCKNCHLLTSANWDEDCYYGFCVVDCSNCVDSLWCTGCELCYECVSCQGCYNLRFGQDCDSCVDCSFMYECRGCNNCILCVGLRGKKHHILNKPVSPEEYERVMHEIKGSHEKYQQMIRSFEELKNECSTRKAADLVKSEDCTGNNIFNSRGVENGFDIYECEDCANLHDGLKGKDCQIA